MIKIKQIVKKCIEISSYTFRCIVRFLSDIFNIFPIHNKRIVFMSFNGKQYSCNPRAISEKMYSETASKKYQIVWVFDDPKKFESMLPVNIIQIKKHSILYPYYMKTAKVIVTNARGYGMIKKRKEQVIIQTWHASNGYKKLIGDKGLSGKMSRLACKDFSYCMSGCANMTKERIEGTFGFNGPIIKGTPRMDIIFGNEHELCEKKVHEKYNIESDYQIILYAPTYRSSLQKDFGLNYHSLLASIEKRFGGKWVLLVRMHYFVKPKIDNSNIFIDATNYPDMQELLLATNILVSDYSSCIWDYSFLYRPCFLFCNDLYDYEKYLDNKHPIRSWGFPISTNTKELEDSILSFDYNKFVDNMKKHHISMGSYEDGKATDRVIAVIENTLNS